GMTLRVPILKVNDVTAAKRPRPVSVRRFLTRCLPETLLPFFPARQLIRIHVSVPRLVPHQLHEPLGRLAFHLEHHRALQRAQPVVREKKWDKDGRYPNWNEPFIPNVTRRMKRQAFCRELVIELSDERFERGSLEL